MTKKVLIFTCCIALLAATAQAGLFKNSVDLADLSEVPQESLETLKDTEFAAFVAEVRLNNAKASERRAAGGVKAANRTLEAENLDMKAAKAELKAAESNEDATRMTAAKARIARADEDLETAKALRKWKSQEQEAQQAQVAVAKSALDLAEAKRDAARVGLLHRENASSRDKYDLGDFERNVAKREKEHDTAGRKARGKMDKVNELKIAWERLAKNIELAETE